MRASIIIRNMRDKNDCSIQLRTSLDAFQLTVISNVTPSRRGIFSFTPQLKYNNNRLSIAEEEYINVRIWVPTFGVTEKNM